MYNLVEWISRMFDMPGLSFMTYIISGVLMLVFADAIIGLIVSAVYTIFRGR